MAGHGCQRRLNNTSERRLDPSTARIVIVGAGLAGLSTAIFLQRAGFRHIHIYERDCSLDQRREGYGLTLTYNPTGILHHLQVLDAIADQDCPSRSHYLFHADGSIRGYYGNAFRRHRGGSGGFGQRGNLRVPRQKVRQILYEQLLLQVKNGSTTSMSASAVEIHWSHKLVDVKEVPPPSSSASSLAIDGTNGKSTQKSVSVLELTFEQQQSNNNSKCSNPLVAVKVLADVCIGADGIRSAVVKSWLPMAPPPRPLGIRLILGLTKDFQNPDLLHERGFYTLADGKRFFVMPYAAPSPMVQDNQNDNGDTNGSNTPVRYMWQLSFTAEVEEPVSSSSSPSTTTCSSAQQPKPPTQYAAAQALQQEALVLTADWHEPVQSMILSTPIESIWGTHLYDRDPAELQHHHFQRIKERMNRNNNSSCNGHQPTTPLLLLAGDALHAMSPFKGQGANQSLQDGKTIADCLTRNCSPAAAVQAAWRELVHRTAKTVHASRQAAQYWHSPDAAQQATHSFAGVECYTTSISSRSGIRKYAVAMNDSESHQAAIATFLEMLQQRGVTAETPKLDNRVGEVLDDWSRMNSGSLLAKGATTTTTTSVAAAAISPAGELLTDKDLQQVAMEAARMGDRGRLRELSWQNPDLLRSMGAKLLQQTKDARTRYWLVAEAGCCRDE